MQGPSRSVRTVRKLAMTAWALLFSSMSVGCLELAVIGMISGLDEDDSAEECDWEYEGATRVSSQLARQNLVLSPATPNAYRELRVSTQGLTSAQSASIGTYLTAEARYPDSADIASGELRELPRVRLTLESPANAFASRSLQTEGGVLRDVVSADVSLDVDEGTGNTEVIVGVTIERVDGAPFGEVEVSLSGRATLELRECTAVYGHGVSTEWSSDPGLPPTLGSDAGPYVPVDAGTVSNLGDAGWDAIAESDAGGLDGGGLDGGRP